MPLFQGFCPVAGTICPSLAAAVVGPSRAPQGMKKGRRPRRRPRLKLSDKAGPDQCPVPGENALFPAQIAGFLAVSRAVPVYPVFLNYVVPVQWKQRWTRKIVLHGSQLRKRQASRTICRLRKEPARGKRFGKRDDLSASFFVKKDTFFPIKQKRGARRNNGLLFFDSIYRNQATR